MIVIMLVLMIVIIVMMIMMVMSMRGVWSDRTRFGNICQCSAMGGVLDGHDGKLRCYFR